MFWTIAGIVLVVVLVVAWFYDRRTGGRDLTARDRAAYDVGHHQAQADGDVTRYNGRSGDGL